VECFFEEIDLSSEAEHDGVLGHDTRRGSGICGGGEEGAVADVCLRDRGIVCSLAGAVIALGGRNNEGGGG